MKKLLIRLALIVVVLVAIVGIGLMSYLDSMTKTAIETGGTYALGVKTTLGSADLKILGGELNLANLSVANPDGYKDEQFLGVGSGHVTVELSSLRSDTVEIPSLVLSDINVFLERQDGKANYKVIIENLKRLQSDEPAEDTEGGKKYVIRELIIRDVNVSATLLPLDGDATRVSVALEDDIVLENVGSGGEGIELTQVVGIVMKAILAAIGQVGGQLPGNIAEGLGDAMAGIGDLGGQLFEAADDITSGAADHAKGAADEVGKALEDVGKNLGDAAKGIGNILGGKKDD